MSNNHFEMRSVKLIGTIILYCFVLGMLWEITVIALDIPAYVIPKLSFVSRSFFDFPAFYLRNLASTATASVTALLVAVVLGTSAATIMFWFSSVKKVVYPIIVGSQVFPKEALAPVFVILLGFGMATRITFASLICFFPITVSVIRGLQQSPRPQIEFFQSLGAPRWTVFVNCRMPFAAPYFFAGVKLAATLSIVGAVVGEFLGSSGGLGNVIVVAVNEVATERIFVSLVLLGIYGGLLYGVVSIIELLVARGWTES